MRCIIQRVNRASIVINGKSGGQIGKGLLVLCAFSDGDDEKTVDYCVEKIANLRIFEDENGKLNLSVLDVKGNVMVVSNFTLPPQEYRPCFRNKFSARQGSSD